MTVILAVYGFIFGLCFGSFANVLIYRLPRELPFVKDYSHCVRCGHRIMPYDLIPVFSYIFLRGRCRYCGDKISAMYPCIELAGGLCGVLAAVWFGLSWQMPFYFLIFILLLTITVIDAQHMIIPNGLVIALALLVVPLSFLCPDVSWFSRFAGFFALSLPMLLTNLFIKDAFGGGDIKLMAVCGFMLGLAPVVVAGFFGILTAGSRAISVVLSGKPYKQVHMPFGPYLCFGVLIAILWGERIARWYLGLL